MKEDLYDDLYLEEKEEKTDFKAILFKYAIHWPWFVACTLLCMAGAWLYLRYTPPVYNISASVIIKDNDKNSKASSGMGDLEDLGFYSSINNFDNEVEILQSRTLIKKWWKNWIFTSAMPRRAVSMTSNFTKVPL